MSEQTMEDILNALYDLIQDARNAPLSSDKCVVERDKVLDMLDEVMSKLPAELKQSRTIVDSRNDLIAQARREAEGILRSAREEAAQLVTQEDLMASFETVIAGTEKKHTVMTDTEKRDTPI